MLDLFSDARANREGGGGGSDKWYERAERSDVEEGEGGRGGKVRGRRLANY